MKFENMKKVQYEEWFLEPQPYGVFKTLSWQPI